MKRKGWMCIRLLPLPPSAGFAGELRWPAHTLLDSSYKTLVFTLSTQHSVSGRWVFTRCFLRNMKDRSSLTARPLTSVYSHVWWRIFHLAGKPNYFSCFEWTLLSMHLWAIYEIYTIVKILNEAKFSSLDLGRLALCLQSPTEILMLCWTCRMPCAEMKAWRPWSALTRIDLSTYRLLKSPSSKVVSCFHSCFGEQRCSTCSVFSLPVIIFSRKLFLCDLWINLNPQRA